ncbi:MAG: hypothetical protein Q8K37_03495 [Alphaproteobacteria bacterium]|nr:hypothetical protein [Alphaproteobacteria bacterium]
MRKFLLSLVSFLALSASAQALDVLVQNESDHAVQIYASHTAYIPSFLSTDKKWYYVGPYQSIKVKAHDEKTTRIYMYRVNLKAALSNALYLGGVYTGSTALSMSNAFAWIPAAAVVATTTWKGLPFTIQIIDPKAPIERNKPKAILIENYSKNNDTIQSVQAIADLNQFIYQMITNIGPMVNEHREFTERYNQLADLVTHNDNLWMVFDVANALELDLNKAVGLKIKTAQKKSITRTIEDLRSIIVQLPAMKKEFDDLQQLQGINFYIAAVKLIQKINNLRGYEDPGLIPEPSSEDILSSSSQQSDEEEFPVPPELD